MPIISSSNHLSAYCYGGVFDIEDDEENLSGTFFNDMFQLDLEKMCWRSVSVTGKKDKDVSTRRRKNITEVDNGEYLISFIFKTCFLSFFNSTVSRKGCALSYREAHHRQWLKEEETHKSFI